MKILRADKITPTTSNHVTKKGRTMLFFGASKGEHTFHLRLDERLVLPADAPETLIVNLSAHRGGPWLNNAATVTRHRDGGGYTLKFHEELPGGWSALLLNDHQNRPFILKAVQGPRWEWRSTPAPAPVEAPAAATEVPATATEAREVLASTPAWLTPDAQAFIRRLGIPVL